MSDERVIVVGGGIAGLATGIALRRAGIPFTLIERAPELRNVGAGMQVWTNGVWALERLGLSDKADAIGNPIERMMFRTWRGATLIDIPIAELAAQEGLKPPMVVQRPQLLEMLADELKDTSLVRTASVAGFEQNADGVTVTLDDGRELSGAVLVGADGANSAIRATVFPGTDIEYRGYQYFRALAPPIASNTPDVSSFMLGRGDRFGIEGGRDWTYVFGAIVTPEGTRDTERGRKQDFLDRFRGFASPALEAIEALPEETIGRADVYDIDPLESWVDRRVALIGDAAHAITPNRGRGSGESFEDAVVLSECLSAVDSLADDEAVTRALLEFDTRRRPPTVSLQKSARKIGELAGWSNPVLCSMRELLMKNIVSRAMLKEMREECAELGGRRAVAPSS